MPEAKARIKMVIGLKSGQPVWSLGLRSEVVFGHWQQELLKSFGF